MTIDRALASESECRSLPYVGLEDIEKETGNFTPDFRPMPETLLASKFRFTPRHVLYGKLRPYLNKVALPTFGGVCTTEILPLLPKAGKLERGYLYAVLLSPRFVNWASQNVSGANLPRIDPKRLLEFEIPLLPLEKQRAIGCILEHADRLRRIRRYALELGDSFLGETFVSLFGDVTLKKNQWSEDRLGNLVRKGDKINYGVVQPGSDLKEGNPLVRVADMDDLESSWPYLKRIDPKIDAQHAASRLRGDEILVACVGATLGKVAKAFPKVCGSNIARAVARIPGDWSKINREFLAEYLNTPGVQHYFAKEARTVAQATLNIMQIEKTPVILPPRSQQQQFASIVGRHERLRGAHREALRQAEHLFQTLLHRAFTTGL